MKKKPPNFLMVPAIAVTVMGGLPPAFALREQASDHLGSRYQIAPIPDNCLTGGGDKICTVPIVRCNPSAKEPPRGAPIRKASCCPWKTHPSFEQQTRRAGASRTCPPVLFMPEYRLYRSAVRLR